MSRGAPARPPSFILPRGGSFAALCAHQSQFYYAAEVDVNQYPAIIRCFADTFFPTIAVPQAIPLRWLNRAHAAFIFFATERCSTTPFTMQFNIVSESAWKKPKQRRRRYFYKHYYVFMNIGYKLNVKCNAAIEIANCALSEHCRKSIPPYYNSHDATRAARLIVHRMKSNSVALCASSCQQSFIDSCIYLRRRSFKDSLCFDLWNFSITLKYFSLAFPFRLSFSADFQWNSPESGEMRRCLRKYCLLLVLSVHTVFLRDAVFNEFTPQRLLSFCHGSMCFFSALDDDVVGVFWNFIKISESVCNMYYVI